MRDAAGQHQRGRNNIKGYLLNSYAHEDIALVADQALA